MVGMHLGGAPVGDFVGFSVPGEQGVALLVLEDHQGWRRVVPWIRVPAI